MDTKIRLTKVKVHNLKAVDLTIESNALVVFTGVSGSGKSSMAFDTIYAEGQRRYVTSLSTYAQRQLGDMVKPDLEHAEGISPTISIEQKSAGRNPRSTVGTMTEIYDYLRVLYARIGIPHCPISGEAVMPQSRERIIKVVQSMPEKSKIIVLSPHARSKKGEFKDDFADLLRKGYTRARVDGNFIELGESISLDGTVSHDVDVVIDRIATTSDNHSRIAESVTNALNLGNGVMSIYNVDTKEETNYSMHAFSPKSGLSYTSLEPHDFSFNSPSGMCPRCNGLGTVNEFQLDKIIDPEKSIADDCCSVGSSYKTVRFGNIYDNIAEIYKFSVKTPWKKLSEQAKKVFLYGTDKKWTRMHFVHPETGATWTDHVQWRGVLHEAHTRYAEATSDVYRKKMQALMTEQICPACHGERLKPYPAATQLAGKRISEITHMTIDDASEFIDALQLSPTELHIAEELIKEIRERLHFLKEVGLGYLTLDRTAPTLSGGEAQRVRLASQIGCGLVGITYVLDEPSIGLHPRDNKKLITTLKHLRDMGNTVIVVEHDEETIWEADSVVDFGPGAGSRGGEIIVNGTVEDLIDSKESITGAFLSGRKSIPIPKKRRKPGKESLKITGVTHHNLNNVSVDIPLGVFVAVTGVSGSGKSSLISDVLFPALSHFLHKGEMPTARATLENNGATSQPLFKDLKGLEHIDKVIAIDQSPIGRNPRSNPATYIKVFDEIRDLYSQLPESQARGYKPGRFSFNVKEGSCPNCEGNGMIKIDMDFMEDNWIECPVCNNKRFDEETLSVLYKGKSIYDILEMEIGEAANFFTNIPGIKHKLDMLVNVGLDYIKLGQSSTTLSGGEAQRIKLAKELVRPSTGKTFYILDEPTTGLHFHDINHLLKVLHELVDRGNSVVVIEHNMDVVKTADWIIDIGPEGGWQGGKIIATATPEKVSKNDTPTGHAISAALHHSFEAHLKEARKRRAERIKNPQKSVENITVQGAEQNNLKHVDVTVPRNAITVFTGPSGSGKTSLAYETIYAEGQRRYTESLSPYARQFIKQMPKPKVGHVEGLSPAVAIEQKSHAGNPRSTVGTMTEIYDYLRVLYAHIGIPHCPETGEVIKAVSKGSVSDRLLALPLGDKLQILAPVALAKQESIKDVIARLQRLGFLRIRLNGTYYDIDSDEIEKNFDKKRKNELCLVVDRLKIAPDIRNRLLEAIENATHIGNNKLIAVHEDSDIFFNLSFSVASTGKSYPEITPKTFAFNNAEGMCLDCLGLGYQYGANLTHKPEIMTQPAAGLIEWLWGDKFSSTASKWFDIFLDSEGIDAYIPLRELPAKKLQMIMAGSPPDKWYKTHHGLTFQWKGINNVLARVGSAGKTEVKASIIPFLDEVQCYSCKGSRLNPLARCVTIKDTSISTLCDMPIDAACTFIESIKLQGNDKKVLEEVYKQLVSRLQFLCNVGLEYISLERRAPTLSGGESQRIRLARQLGSGLRGVLYVLDEPTIGLHPKDTEKLNNALTSLKDLGNSLILVEHDPQTIEKADYIVDFGPHAGAHGGHITARGSYQDILKNPNSLTGRYLSGELSVSAEKKRRTSEEFLTIADASTHNLQEITAEIPIGALTCITGVSGSGKSTLMNDVMLPALQKGLFEGDSTTYQGATITGISNFDRIISIDQNPIGHTARSDVGTYVDLLTRMREFFAMLPIARSKGLQGKHFSYNHRRGMCTTCWGMGYKKVEMHFLPAVRVACESCHGLRLNPVSLEVVYAGKNFGEYLDMTVDEIRSVFQNHPRIVRILDTLISVGLGYLKIGQEMATLSGGEAQRIKLSRELAKRSTGRTLYLLDEPTTGLHFEDIKKLLGVLQRLVDKGNTMVIVEHNLDLIKNADHIIDLGPGAGKYGGRIVCAGTPEAVAKKRNSATGQALKESLKK